MPGDQQYSHNLICVSVPSMSAPDSYWVLNLTMYYVENYLTLNSRRHGGDEMHGVNVIE